MHAQHINVLIVCISTVCSIYVWCFAKRIMFGISVQTKIILNYRSNWIEYTTFQLMFTGRTTYLFNRRYQFGTKQSISETNGPITVNGSKKRHGSAFVDSETVTKHKPRLPLRRYPLCLLIFPGTCSIRQTVNSKKLILLSDIEPHRKHRSNDKQQNCNAYFVFT